MCCDLSVDPPCKGRPGWHGEPSPGTLSRSASRSASRAASSRGARHGAASRLKGLPGSAESMLGESMRNRRGTGVDWGGAAAETEFPW